MLVTLRSPTYKGSSSSGWYAPPKGTHTGEKHRQVGSGKVNWSKGAAGKKPKVIEVGSRVKYGGDYAKVLEVDPDSGWASIRYDDGSLGFKRVSDLHLVSSKPKVSKSGKPSTVKAEQVIRPPSSLLESKVSSDINRAADNLGISEAEVEARALSNLQDIVDASDLTIRAPARVLDKIIESGGFRNQHHTDVGASGGTFDPDYRAKAESNVFTVTPGDPPDAFPIYGYLQPQRGAAIHGYGERGIAEGYGNVRFVLKQEVRQRATITVGDSLGAFNYDDVGPAPLTKINKYAIDQSFRDMAGGNLRYVSYIEAQIHGGVKLSDIDHVVFPKGYSFGPEEVALERAGIKYVYE